MSTDLGKDRSRSLAQVAVEHIHRRILAGELQTGSRISDLRLSKEIGISRTPVREAINQLASGGLLEQIPGLGAFVRIPDDQEVLELLQVREHLESMVIQLAAPVMDETAWGQLRAIIRQAVQLIHEVRRLPDRRPTTEHFNRHAVLDMEFHQVLRDNARNRFVQKIMHDLHLMNRIFAHKHQNNPEEGLRMFVRTWREHEQILHALTRRDADMASRLMVQHIQNYPKIHFDRIRYLPNQSRDSITPAHAEFLRRRNAKDGGKY